MGTHPIFESDFDCLTECRHRHYSVPPVGLPSVWVITGDKNDWPSSSHKEPLKENEKKPLQRPSSLLNSRQTESPWKSMQRTLTSTAPPKNKLGHIPIFIEELFTLFKLIISNKNPFP